MTITHNLLFHYMSLTLPAPSDDAQTHSLRLQALLKARIKKHGKISFHDYMHYVLYEPGLGYYSAGSCKLGVAGDFITAPELSPLFAAGIVQQLLPAFSFLKKWDWLELGAGTGKLAKAILSTLSEQQALPEHYYILEVSADLKQRQQQALRMQLPQNIFSRIVWLDQLPQDFQGIILANEVCDALAVHRFYIDETGVVQEYFIDLKEDQFIECLDYSSSAYLQERIKQLSIQGPYSSEINLQQEALLKTLSDSLHTGMILFIDYGFPAKEFYHPDRNQGTLMCHYQHHAHSEALFWPGLQDITAHVDFTALARAGIESGLSLLNFSTQAAWLLNGQILELAAKRWITLSDTDRLLEKQAVHKLLAPEEMGELFKVLLFGKNLPAQAMHTTKFDMRHRL